MGRNTVAIPRVKLRLIDGVLRPVRIGRFGPRVGRYLFRPRQSLLLLRHGNLRSRLLLDNRPGRRRRFRSAAKKKYGHHQGKNVLMHGHLRAWQSRTVGLRDVESSKKPLRHWLYTTLSLSSSQKHQFAADIKSMRLWKTKSASYRSPPGLLPHFTGKMISMCPGGLRRGQAPEFHLRHDPLPRP